MIKNWKTTVLGIIGAATILATSKGWIDNDIATFIGASVVAIFGLSTKDHNVTGGTKQSIGGTIPPPDKDEK